MSVSVRWSPKSQKDLKKLSTEVAGRVIDSVRRLADEDHGDVKRLKDYYPAEYRLRVGDWRVRFVREPDTRDIGIIRVLHRSKAYD